MLRWVCKILNLINDNDKKETYKLGILERKIYFSNSKISIFCPVALFFKRIYIFFIFYLGVSYIYYNDMCIEFCTWFMIIKIYVYKYNVKTIYMYIFVMLLNGMFNVLFQYFFSFCNIILQIKFVFIKCIKLW